MEDAIRKVNSRENKVMKEFLTVLDKRPGKDRPKGRMMIKHHRMVYRMQWQLAMRILLIMLMIIGVQEVRLEKLPF